MTFIKKFMDMLNMDNWKDNRPNDENNYAFSSFPIVNTHKSILKNIHSFWKLYPQTYRSDITPEASLNEYQLYGKVLMLYAVGKGFPIMSSDEYPVYLYREGHITNPHKLHISLVNDGYLVLATVTQMLTARKMAELKILADSVGCKKSGTKAVLAHRIISSMDDMQLAELISQNNCYYLSDKGVNFLLDNNDYIELHRHINYEISLYEYNLQRFCGGVKRTFNDAAFHALSQRIYRSCSESYFFTLENDYISLYNITISEHEYDIAIDSYLRALYIKTCCLHKVIYMSHYTIEDFSALIVFSNNTASTLQKIERFYNDNIVVNIYNDLSLPPSFLTESEFISAVNDMLYETFCDLSKHNDIIRERLLRYNEQLIGNP